MKRYNVIERQLADGASLDSRVAAARSFVPTGDPRIDVPRLLLRVGDRGVQATLRGAPADELLAFAQHVCQNHQGQLARIRSGLPLLWSSDSWSDAQRLTYAQVLVAEHAAWQSIVRTASEVGDHRPGRPPH